MEDQKKRKHNGGNRSRYQRQYKRDAKRNRYGDQHDDQDFEKQPDKDSLPTPVCPLCLNENTVHFSSAFKKNYYSCTVCTLVFVHQHYHVTEDKEKTRYQFHNNSPLDKKYVSFLQPAFNSLLPLLPTGARGLDYGCGPGPALSLMFGEKGHTMENYDPYFMPNDKVKQVEEGKTIEPFDFVTCTEAIEHFRRPKDDLDKLLLKGMVKTGGHLLFMTQFLKNDEMFATWHYPRDITHICFFRGSTFQWIAKHYQCELTLLDNENIAILKPTESTLSSSSSTSTTSTSTTSTSTTSTTSTDTSSDNATLTTISNPITNEQKDEYKA
ncbi:hypothetical protein SAMD00019534_077400 [Acytostelium subglobosum LB1]|uniref:hypothetical protein n=1 Tax=Acytostelium subglobosum LB1 TaxID=1410327 RepID=UPI000644DB03|nr:hypothetical protein SAMD00019534_077400 [Acytostelium subglobosum LB1]GAM24565.1 hypothetical protein SAMD00019534_077400 [Acytostelium subglobosum LB1]|eukprot:XP_012752234.1 hypothetical protein SAMD00019534_077400 [Acytostelium subglobosum LB1]